MKIIENSYARHGYLILNTFRVKIEIATIPHFIVRDIQHRRAKKIKLRAQVKRREVHSLLLSRIQDVREKADNKDRLKYLMKLNEIG